MLIALTLILALQFIGELISSIFSLPIPGPVLGMVLLLIAFVLNNHLAEVVRPIASTLLGNLSLFFVPAGVGIMRYGERLSNEALAITLSITLSTIIAILTTLLVMHGMIVLQNRIQKKHLQK